MAIEVTEQRTQAIRVFSYGLDLDLCLLHTIIGGPKPCCGGPAWLSGFTRSFSVSGHLPGLTAREGGAAEGAITLLVPEQLQRMGGWLLSYRAQRFTTTARDGLQAPAWVFLPTWGWHRPGRPSVATLQSVFRGAVDRGLSDTTLKQLAAWCPTAQEQLLRSTGRNLVFST